MPVRMYAVSSLEKVFLDEAPREMLPGALSGLKGETVSFQAAFSGEGPMAERQIFVMEAECALPLRTRLVGQVPVRFPCHRDTEGAYLRREPGLYPDPLLDLPRRSTDGQTARILPVYRDQWQAVWIDVAIGEDAEAGEYLVALRLVDEEGAVQGEIAQAIRVVDVKLPAQRLIHTRWLHCDALADYYSLEMFSPAHFDVLKAYVGLLARRGGNMLLTPIHTPPLDTRQGGQRRTAQLVDVFVDEEGRYSFRFDKLRLFIRMAQEAGIAYFEMAHLFTQWGAYHAPKIVGMKEGRLQQLFGWQSDALGEGYQGFLSAYLPALIGELRVMGILQRCYFHISDEPDTQHLEQYRAARESVLPYLKGLKVIDALSDYRFYEQGLTPLPVPAINHLAPFLDADIGERWTYYCVGQHRKMSNCFLSMPAGRTRVLGVQCYLYQIKGFLQWGYNFWYSQYADYPVDPWQVTDADGFAPAGDAFQVYPGRDGQPVESLRLMYFHQAMQDLRALTALEEKAGRQAVLSLIAEGLPHLPTLEDYPANGLWLEDLRERVNRALAGA